MVKRLYIEWVPKKGSLMATFKPYELVIAFKNIIFMLLPREVRISSNVEKFEEEKHGKKHYIYVKLSENVNPISAKGEYVQKPRIIEGFELRYTNIDFSRYLTVITPGIFLYNYMIISDNEVFIETSVNKEVYFEELKGALTIYFV